MTIGKSA